MEKRAAKHLEAARAAGVVYAEALEARNIAVYRAVQGGLSYRVVGAAVGLSYEAVRKIHERAAATRNA